MFEIKNYKELELLDKINNLLLVGDYCYNIYRYWGEDGDYFVSEKDLDSDYACYVGCIYPLDDDYSFPVFSVDEVFYDKEFFVSTLSNSIHHIHFFKFCPFWG